MEHFLQTLSKAHEALGNMKNLQSKMLQQDIGPSQNSLKAKKNFKKSENCWTRK